MADYIIKFVAHLIPGRRPRGFPKRVSSDLIVAVKDTESLLKATNQKYAYIINVGGMFVFTDPMWERAEFVPDSQIFIPLTMIAFIETITTKLTSEIPEDVAIGLLS